MELEAMRIDYTRGELHREDLAADPFAQFNRWFEQALQAKVHEPNAMSLATATAGGLPTLRTVLLKHFDERGFVFFTNYESKKARQMAENPNVALLFPWLTLERQIIITGTVEKTPSAESLRYFLQRPVESRLGAWASPQSRVVESRKFLEMKFAEIKNKFAQGEIPLPSFWGGFRVLPRSFEFWQGRKNRLHDRFFYSQTAAGQWQIEQLAP